MADPLLQRIRALRQQPGIEQMRAELRRKQKLAEDTLLSLDNLISPLDWQDAGFGGYGAWRWGRPVDRTMDRTHAPLNYLNEQDWRWALAEARNLVQRNHLASGFRDHISAFVGPVSVSFVLRGQAPGAASVGDDGDAADSVDPLVKACTQCWEEWCELSDWGQGLHDREAECRRRLIVEGEATLMFFESDARNYGLPYARHVEPELIRTPPGHSTMDRHGWGVITGDDDDEDELGLWVCRYDNVSEGREVPFSEYVRIKANVDRTVKRGWSDFNPVGDQLRKIMGLLDNMAHVARLQAAIAWWEQYPTATAQQVSNMITAGADYSRTRIPPNATGAQTDVSNYEAGTVVRTEGGREVQPGPTAAPDGFAQVEQMVLRSIGFRWGCPSYFSGQSDDSFASVLVTGSPFVRITEARQEEVKGFARRVATRVLEFAERSGRLPRGAARRVRPVANAKPVVMADEEKQARTFLSLYDKNCADPVEFIRERGGDPKVVAANIRAWQKKFPPPQPNAPGAAGASPAGDVTTQDADATPPGSAGGDGTSPNEPTQNIFGANEPTAEWLARRAVARWVRERGFTGKDSHGHYWQDGKQVKAPQQQPAQQPGAGNPELSDNDKRTIASGIDRDVAALPDAQRPDAGTVAKAKDLAITAVAHAYLFLNRIAVTRTFALVGEAIDAALDSPADMMKLGYNPNASSGTANPQVLDPVKAATGLSGHLVASVAARVITKAVFYAKGKLAQGAATEANEGADAIRLWAEFISQLLSHLTEELGGPPAPAPEVVARHLAAFARRAESKDASGHAHSAENGQFVSQGGGGESHEKANAERQQKRDHATAARRHIEHAPAKSSGWPETENVLGQAVADGDLNKFGAALKAADDGLKTAVTNARDRFVAAGATDADLKTFDQVASRLQKKLDRASTKLSKTAQTVVAARGRLEAVEPDEDLPDAPDDDQVREEYEQTHGPPPPEPQEPDDEEEPDEPTEPDPPEDVNGEPMTGPPDRAAYTGDDAEEALRADAEKWSAFEQEQAAYSSARAAWEQERAGVQNRNAAKSAAHEKAHAAWEKASERYDAGLEKAGERAQAAWDKEYDRAYDRNAKREERRDAAKEALDSAQNDFDEADAEHDEAHSSTNEDLLEAANELEEVLHERHAHREPDDEE